MNDLTQLETFLRRWLERQGYFAHNCRCDDFVAWYLENYPEGDKSVPNAFYASDWRIAE